MKNKKVSVLIPTYHSDITLHRAIDSVLTQNYEDFEVIVVDDNNPTDEYRRRTELLMQPYASDERVKYIQHETNKNGSVARNTAFANSEGEYITFLDDDDFYYPDKLKYEVEFLENNPQFGGCYCWRRSNGKDICGKYEGDLSEQILSLEFTPCTPTLMVRRECYIELNGFDESYRRHQDFEFLLRFFEKYSLGYVPSVQVEISTNGVNNAPKGKKLVELKQQFFSQFSSKIEAIYEINPCVGQKIYRNHFVRVYKDLLRYGHPILATRIYFEYKGKCGSGFWNLFFKLCFESQYHRITGKWSDVNHNKGARQ